MPRRPEISPYQLGFNFEVPSGETPESQPISSETAYRTAQGIVAQFASRETTLGRFVNRLQEPIPIRSPADLGCHLLDQVYTPFSSIDQEELWVHLINTRSFLTVDAMVYRGTVDSVGMVRPAEVFIPAVRINAPALVLSHVHPSGNPLPSPEDIQATRNLIDAGRLLQIEILDHIVVGNNDWVSIREKGLDFDS